MMDFISHLQQQLTNSPANLSVTENGAVGYKSTGRALVDLNFAVSSLRKATEKDIRQKFAAALAEEGDVAIVWLFFVRDVRGGLGERRLFRICMHYLAEKFREKTIKLLPLIAEYGRWDDLIDLLDTKVSTEVQEIIKNQLTQDIKDQKEEKSISLLAKWMPSENASSLETKRKAQNLRMALGMTPRTYRLVLSKLRKYIGVLERKMSAGDWNDISYEGVPSRANLKYNSAFLRHDETRRREFLGKLEKGETKINASTMFPHDIVHQYGLSMYGVKARNADPALEAMWNSLPNAIQDDGGTIVVADGSGSMSCKVDSKGSVTALEVANALAIYFAERLKGQYHDKYMLEVQYHNTEKQKEINRFILGLYRKYGIPLIVGMDSHYIYPEDAVARDLRLEANGIRYNNEEGWYMDYPSDEECYQRFVEQGVLAPAQIKEAMDNTNIFLSFEDIVFDQSKKLPTIYPELTQEQRNQKYSDLVWEKWDEYKKTVPESMWSAYEEGISYEVDTITSTNTSDYFLMDYELVKRGKAKGGKFTYTGRGSAPSFFTNTLLGFSYIDRFALPVTMYPDRFISKDRLLSGSLPDLDMNCGEVEPFIEAQAEIMGEWHSAPMIAYGTMKRSKAWKMYCRANKVEYSIANEISNNLKNYEEDLKYADDDDKDDYNVYDYVPEEYHQYVKESERYLGIIDTITPHPCAHLLCMKDIRREVGIYRISSKTGKKKIVYAAFIDGATAEQYGYLKNDILKVTVVKQNAEVYARIGIPQPSVSELLRITKNDDATWSMYSKGYTLGLNQVEKEKSTDKVMRYRPRNISEMSAFVAGIRPAFQSMINLLLDRKHFDYGIPALDKLLQTKEMSSSFILYQEQMMTVLQYGSFSAPESYSSIKAIAKKHPEKVLPLKERFLEGFANHLQQDDKISPEFAKETADKVWVIISDACGYGFNSCLVGSTKMYRAKSGHGFTPTIEEMYRIRHDVKYAKESGHYPLHKKYKRCGYGTALSLGENNRVRENEIIDIYDQGIRNVCRITTESGKTVVCTANHKFPVGNYSNLVRCDKLCVGDPLYVMGEYEQTKTQYRFTDGNAVSNVPKKGQRGFQCNPDGASVQFIATRSSMRAQKCSCDVCESAYSPSLHFELHHKDHDRTNNKPENLIWTCNACHKKAHYQNGRTKRYQKGIPTYTDKIISIEYAGQEHVYDVEMADPYHNFVLENGLVTGNSHSVAVALDSLYGAYAKAHYPLEYYAILLSNYSEKGDKKRIAQAKDEMKRAFGIRLVPCRFRQDNRDYFIDKEHNSISDALTSVKSIGKRVADALYAMKDRQYPNFTYLLLDMELQSAFNKSSIEVLIRMGYFQEFGSDGKLLKLFREFKDGKNKYSKTHVEATQKKRLSALCEYEETLPDEPISFADHMQFEVEYYGTPITQYPDKKMHYAVLDVDEKYSPKIRLYDIATGRIGMMKIKKKEFQKKPVQRCDIIHLKDWVKRPAYSFVDGKPAVKPDVFDLWMIDYDVLATMKKEDKNVPIICEE